MIHRSHFRTLKFQVKLTLIFEEERMRLELCIELRVRLHLFKYDLDHLITDSCSFREPGSKVFLYTLKAVAIRLKVAKGDTFRPGTSGKSEFQIISSEGMILDRSSENFV